MNHSKKSLAIYWHWMHFISHECVIFFCIYFIFEFIITFSVVFSSSKCAMDTSFLSFKPMASFWMDYYYTNICIYIYMNMYICEYTHILYMYINFLVCIMFLVCIVFGMNIWILVNKCFAHVWERKYLCFKHLLVSHSSWLKDWDLIFHFYFGMCIAALLIQVIFDYLIGETVFSVASYFFRRHNLTTNSLLQSVHQS